MRDKKKDLSPENNNLFYSLEISDVAGNRFQALRLPLKRPVSEVQEKPVEKKKEKWIEDF